MVNDTPIFPFFSFIFHVADGYEITPPRYNYVLNTLYVRTETVKLIHLH